LTRGSPSPAAQTSPDEGSLDARQILGMRVDATTYADANARILEWATARASRSVFVAAVNNVMVSHDDPSFLAVMNSADLVTPDGMPLVWALRWLGIPSPTRVYGPELMPTVMATAAEAKLPIALFGGTPAVLDALIAKASAAFPDLRVAYRACPPFGESTPEEDAKVAREINASGARIVFVGLGCPKQERWIARQRGDIRAVMIGVGAAFDFMAGAKRQAPALVRRSGFEWLFRLAVEPRRLWRRYLHQNPRFVVLFVRQLLAQREQHRRARSVDQLDHQAAP
jgi:N-acetylglucosaminyldiphosphoundecaprenol N-acetyl-beta-D-mannosaminyltransferase